MGGRVRSASVALGYQLVASVYLSTLNSTVLISSSCVNFGLVSYM